MSNYLLDINALERGVGCAAPQLFVPYTSAGFFQSVDGDC
jgi:hypothetical protein